MYYEYLVNNFGPQTKQASALRGAAKSVAKLLHGAGSKLDAMGTPPAPPKKGSNLKRWLLGLGLLGTARSALRYAAHQAKQRAEMYEHDSEPIGGYPPSANDFMPPGVDDVATEYLNGRSISDMWTGNNN